MPRSGRIPSRKTTVPEEYSYPAVFLLLHTNLSGIGFAYSSKASVLKSRILIAGFIVYTWFFGSPEYTVTKSVFRAQIMQI